MFNFFIKEILLFVTTWMNLEDIMLSDVSWAQKDKHYMVPLNMMNLDHPLPFPDLVLISPHPICLPCELVSDQSPLTLLFFILTAPMLLSNAQCLLPQCTGTMVFQMRA